MAEPKVVCINFGTNPFGAALNHPRERPRAKEKGRPMQSETSISPTAYERDFALWLATQIGQLRAGDYPELDVAHLVEELEGLAGSDRRELYSHLETLFGHLLKIRFAPTSAAVPGWQITINKTVRAIARQLEQSPSMRNLLNEATYTREFKHAASDFTARRGSLVPDAAYGECVLEIERRLHAEDAS